MICKNCSHENAPEEKICANCGMPLAEDADIISEEEINNEVEVVEEVEETVVLGSNAEEIAEGIEESIEEEIEEITEDADEDEVEAEDVVEDAEDELDEDDDVIIENIVSEEEPKKKSKLFAFSGLIALVVICIGLWIAFTGILAPKYDMPTDRSKFVVSYVKDSALYQKPVSGQSVKISESLSADAENPLTSFSYTVMQSKNGEATFFLENFSMETYSGTLYVSYNGKEKVKIADNVVQGFVISENGKTVVYMSGLDVTNATGQLYYHTKGGQPQLIANSALYQTYMTSLNGGYVSFMENVDPSTGLGELYVVKTGSQPVKIDDAVTSALEISDNGKVLYLKNVNEVTYTYDLYLASASSAPELLATGVTQGYVMASKFSDKVAYVTVNEEQVYNFAARNGNGAEKIVSEDLMGFFAVDIENENYLVAKMSANEEEAAAGNPDMLLKKGNSEYVTIAKNMLTPQHAAASYDFKTIYYLSDFDTTTSTATLRVRKEGFFGQASDEVIATNVSSFKATKNGKAVAYMTDVDATLGTGTLTVYKDGNSKVISTNVYPSLFKLSENGKAVIYAGDLNMETGIANLYAASTTGGSGPSVIDTEIYATLYSRSDKNAIYLKNYDMEANTADLYMWKGRGEPELIDRKSVV